MFVTENVGILCFAVKLWHTNVDHSVASLEVKANVCCVKFNPESRYHLAFGSAGILFSSNAKFPNEKILIMASIELELKAKSYQQLNLFWNINQQLPCQCVVSGILSLAFRNFS